MKEGTGVKDAKVKEERDEAFGIVARLRACIEGWREDSKITPKVQRDSLIAQEKMSERISVLAEVIEDVEGVLEETFSKEEAARKGDIVQIKGEGTSLPQEALVAVTENVEGGCQGFPIWPVWCGAGEDGPIRFFEAGSYEKVGHMALQFDKG